MTADEVLDKTLTWAKTYDQTMYALFSENTDYARKILSIDRGGAKPRKDIARWNQVKEYVTYFYDSLFVPEDPMPESLAAADVNAILTRYAEVFNEADDKDTWFAKIKAMCEPLGFSPDVKAYKKNPECFKGHVGDVSSVIRVAVTGRRNTPDLYEVLRLLGKERVLARLEQAKSH